MAKLFKLSAAASALLAMSLAANAADLPVRPAPAPVYVPPPFSWTGFYIGANLGGAWVHNNWTDTLFLANFNNNSSNGTFIGGGQIGGNYQFGNFVLGAEWDFDWASNNNNGTAVLIPAVGNIVVTSNNRWVSTLAARFGFAVDRVLIYGKAGGGWVGNDNFSIANTTTGVVLTCGNVSNCGNNSNAGWLVGAGLEWAFAPNWSVKFEYDYLGLNSRTVVIPAAAPFLANDTFSSGNRNLQMAKVGVNYLFNWGSAPVAAKY